MNSEHLKGVAETGKGRIKEAVGQITGDKNLTAEGRIDQAKGIAHNAVGDVKDAVNLLIKKDEA